MQNVLRWWCDKARTIYIQCECVSAFLWTCMYIYVCLCTVQELWNSPCCLLTPYTHSVQAQVRVCAFAPKCTPICEYVRGLHTSVCLSYVCKPFVVASVALLLHIHMFFMGWLMELSSSCLCDVVYCCLMCSGILHRRAPRADLIT